jgi:acyl-CoA synthetase (AMP-forming)/AMP-acid ligase II
MFLEYWGRPDATGEVTDSGEWLLTGDLARMDEEGYLWFASRNDDVINSAGYRIGPSEIESCLMHHPAVAMAAAIGVPDASVASRSRPSCSSRPAASRRPTSRRRSATSSAAAWPRTSTRGTSSSSTSCAHDHRQDPAQRAAAARRAGRRGVGVTATPHHSKVHVP